MGFCYETRVLKGVLDVFGRMESFHRITSVCYKKQEGGEDNKEKGKVGCEFELKLVMIIKKTCEFRVSFPSPMKIWGQGCVGSSFIGKNSTFYTNIILAPKHDLKSV